MRLSLALPALAGGLVLGWAACAQADAPPPPAAPIFYCPAPPAKGAPAATAPAPGPQATRLAYHHHVSCPSERHVIAFERHHWAPARREERVVAQLPPRPRGADVSASQAFIYRYELAVHGLNAQAADQAWGHGPPPPHGPPPGAYAQQGPAMPMPPPMRHGWGAHPLPPVPPPPPPAPRAFVEAAPPPMPPAVHIYVHPAPPAPPVQHYGYQHEQQVQHYGYLPGPGPATPPPAWREHSGAAYAYEQRESESEHGWSSSTVNGQTHYERWGDHGRWTDHDRGPCPPSPRGCSAAAASEGSGWRDGSYGQVYKTAGRDASGYLVWPGKTPGE